MYSINQDRGDNIQDHLTIGSLDGNDVNWDRTEPRHDYDRDTTTNLHLNPLSLSSVFNMVSIL